MVGLRRMKALSLWPSLGYLSCSGTTDACPVGYNWHVQVAVPRLQRVLTKFVVRRTMNERHLLHSTAEDNYARIAHAPTTQFQRLYTIIHIRTQFYALFCVL